MKNENKVHNIYVGYNFNAILFTEGHLHDISIFNEKPEDKLAFDILLEDISKQVSYNFANIKGEPVTVEGEERTLRLISPGYRELLNNCASSALRAEDGTIGFKLPSATTFAILIAKYCMPEYYIWGEDYRRDLLLGMVLTAHNHDVLEDQLVSDLKMLKVLLESSDFETVNTTKQLLEDNTWADLVQFGQERVHPQIEKMYKEEMLRNLTSSNSLSSLLAHMRDNI
jgi:hypothetical protein